MRGLGVLIDLQQSLEDIYRVEAGVDVRSFLIDRDTRDHLTGPSEVQEQLLVLDDGQGDELALALYLDADLLVRLEASRHEPARDFSAFLLALEGVSHFVYAAHCARQGRATSQLELELQAEVDKYAACFLAAPVAAHGGSAQLRDRLYRQFDLEASLSPDEVSRYLAANDNAARYSERLERRFVARGAVEPMIAELRRFYRASLPQKLDHIARAA
ncbi:MAG: hypothetical protein IPL79_01105 [Myxococcales bacterium]|nr:hypothetical protein [Myxococcales bacterium]